MKKALLIILVFSVVFALYNLFGNRLVLNPNQNRESKPIISPSSMVITAKKELNKQLIFVPYWSDFKDLNNTVYDRYIYFGISANYQGINKSETGYLKLDRFIEAVEGKEIWLTVRLLNDDFNKNLLKDEDLQQKIIDQTGELLKEKNFSGVVLDLELFSLFNNGISDQINEFVKRFYTSLKSDYKSLALTIYGDTFFRGRPFDLPFISKNSDEILVMAYDFHKSRGEPGPNFPLVRQSLSDGGLATQTYDYDFITMIKDFSQTVPIEKLTIIFGMFGYDWTVDEKKRPFSQAKALTLNEIKNKFINLDILEDDRLQDGKEKFTCLLEDCILKTDNNSKETEINYTISSNNPDEQGIYRIDYHIVWFENEESVKVKTEYLQEQGIGSIGYWAWGYF